MAYEKIDPEFKRKWVEALRSGRYKQGYTTLRRKADDGEDYFCGLGVACDIQAPEFWEEVKGGIWSFGRDAYGQLITALYPKATVYSRSSANVCNLIPIATEAKIKIAAMNDRYTRGRGFESTFNDIADWIEANL